MGLRQWGLLGIACFALASWAMAEDAPVEAAKPAVPAAAADIAAWITDLDANKYAIRAEATQKLIQAGKPAIDAVAEAAQQTKSAEVGSRCLEVLTELHKSQDQATRDAAKQALEKIAQGGGNLAGKAAAIIAPPAEVVPQRQQGIRLGNAQIRGNIQILPGGNIQLNAQPGGAIARVIVRNINGVRNIDAEENGKKVKIVDDPAKGITMEVTEKVEGKEQTKKYEAKNADELKKNHPEADAIYQKYAGKAAGQVQIGVAQIGAIPGVPGFQIQPVDPKLQERIDAARKRLQALTEDLEKRASENPDDATAKKVVEELKEINRDLSDAPADAN